MNVFFLQTRDKGLAEYAIIFPSDRKGLVTPRDHGFFSSKNHVVEEIFKFFFGHDLLL